MKFKKRWRNMRVECDKIERKGGGVDKDIELNKER